MEKTVGNDANPKRKAIILFTRPPMPGRTKTRLQKVLAPEECARLHTCMLYDMKRLCESMQVEADSFVFHSDEDGKELLAEIFGASTSFHAQIGTGLGDRMHNAIETVLSYGYEACVLIGTDIPELQKRDIEEAFDLLNRHDVVIGPTEDHGYYLVGMKKPNKAVFEKQSYGLGNVIGNTLCAIERAGLCCALASVHQDIDEPQDILSFHDRMKDVGLMTSGYIRQLVSQYGDKLNG